MLTVHHEVDDGEPEEIVYQEVDGNEIEPFADFLNLIDDHYGPSTSRYSPARIRITIEPEDKWLAEFPRRPSQDPHRNTSRSLTRKPSVPTLLPFNGKWPAGEPLGASLDRILDSANPSLTVV